MLHFPHPRGLLLGGKEPAANRRRRVGPACSRPGQCERGACLWAESKAGSCNDDKAGGEDEQIEQSFFLERGKGCARYPSV